jgi:hypothetical protein
MARQKWALVRASVAPGSPPEFRRVRADFNGHPKPNLAFLCLTRLDTSKAQFNARDFDGADDRDIVGIVVFKALTKCPVAGVHAGPAPSCPEEEVK